MAVAVGVLPGPAVLPCGAPAEAEERAREREWRRYIRERCRRHG